MGDAVIKQIVYTQKAKCQDCYRCLRVCPVKAIGIKEGQAYIDESRCIVCGTCVKECPQGAITFRNDVYDVKKLLAKNSEVVVSLDSSFAAVYKGWKTKRLASALRKLGFAFVEEFTEGTFNTAAASKDFVRKAGVSNSVCSHCPVVVNYVEKYNVNMLGSLIPVVSPMIAHAKILKEKYGEHIKVVFIGPCIAKKYEMQRREFQDIVDNVITFKELNEWLEEADINLLNCEESEFDTNFSSMWASLSPLPGTLLNSASAAEIMTDKILQISGEQRIRELFRTPMNRIRLEVIEPLFCEEGCINGPAVDSKDSVFERKLNLIQYAKNKPNTDVELNKGNFFTRFRARQIQTNSTANETAIVKVLAQIGRADTTRQFNCGACGYKTCRENAQAVVMGMAEIEMCTPYMRKLSEQRTDKLIETLPNGIVLLDENFNIISMNPAFKKYFKCSEDLIDRRISCILDGHGYEKLMSGEKEKYESVIKFNDTRYHQMIYFLKQEKQYVGIYIDMSDIQMDKEKMDKIKGETVKQAKEFLENHIKMAQNVAKFLGESTAQGEEFIWRLTSIYDEK